MKITVGVLVISFVVCATALIITGHVWWAIGYIFVAIIAGMAVRQ
jgi:hypothetical protein